MKRVKKHIDFISTLVSSKPIQLRALLKTASKEQLDTVREIIHNILLGNLSISELHKQQLIKYKCTFRKIGDPKKRPNRSLFVRNSQALSKLLTIVFPVLKKEV